MTSRHESALREAGHAVCALARGVHLDCISFAPDGHGECIFASACHDSRHNLDIILAGAVALALAAHESPDRGAIHILQHPEDPDAQAALAAAQAAGPNIPPEYAIHRAAYHAAALLQPRWALVKALAARLEHSDWLLRDEIEAEALAA